MKVDVISMSWTIKGSADRPNPEFQDLEAAIKRARKENILMFGSAADQGNHIASFERILPGDAEGVFHIGAADSSGNLDRHVERKVQYILPGGIGDKYQGSSVATAVGAGLTALILHCAEITGFYEKHKIDKSKRKAIREVAMRKIWENMLEGKDRYVYPVGRDRFQVDKYSSTSVWNNETYQGFSDSVEPMLM